MFELVFVLFYISLWIILSFLPFLFTEEKDEVDNNEK